MKLQWRLQTSSDVRGSDFLFKPGHCLPQISFSFIFGPSPLPFQELNFTCLCSHPRLSHPFSKTMKNLFNVLLLSTLAIGSFVTALGDSATDSPVTGQDHLPAELNAPQPVIPAMAAIVVEGCCGKNWCDAAVRNACESGDHDCQEQCESTLTSCQDTCVNEKFTCQCLCTPPGLSCDAKCGLRHATCLQQCTGTSADCAVFCDGDQTFCRFECNACLTACGLCAEDCDTACHTRVTTCQASCECGENVCKTRSDDWSDNKSDK
jgi:hypothetical protein